MLAFTTPFYLSGSHLQTIIPSIFRKVKGVKYSRERILTPDNDFLDLDWSFSNKTEDKIPTLGKSKDDLVILSHGLEGDTSRQYMLGMVKIFNENGNDCLAWNFRSCSGEMNKNIRFYHSGATDDLDLVIRHAISKGYKNVYLIGFSLGGNLSLKYLGEKKPYTEIKKCIVFSVPLDLAGSSEKIAKPTNWIYTKRFLNSLKTKIRLKAKYFPDELKLDNLGKIKTVEAFDEEYTSKLHGFINAKDYYAKNSSIIFVEKITIPTLIVNAQNDPFLSNKCYPTEKLQSHTHVKLEIPLQGGHCGFLQKGYRNFLWSEIRALEFIKSE